ncbi:CHAP domain-containing protein, partial [Patescibacteria group bacterium]
MNKKISICLATLFCLISFIGISFAGDDYCCGYYSPGNPFACTTHEKDGHIGDHGNCTWWCAYKRPEVSGPCLGSAIKWFSQAQSGGLATGQIPTIGSIVVFKIGHVAHVEEIYSDNKFSVSEMGYESWDCLDNEHDDKICDKTSYGGIIGFIYPVGTYADGWKDDGTSQAFVDCYKEYSSFLGSPFDHNGNGTFVHKAGTVFVQDFIQDPSQPHWGDGESCMILNEEMGKAFVLKEGFRDKYFEVNGFSNIGSPVNNSYPMPLCNELDGSNYKVYIRQDFEKGSMMYDGGNVEVHYYYGTVDFKLSGGQLQIVQYGIGGDEPDDNDTGEIKYISKSDDSQILIPRNIYTQRYYSWATGGYVNILWVVEEGIGHQISDVDDFLNTFRINVEVLPPFRYRDKITNRKVNITNTSGMNARWREM